MVQIISYLSTTLESQKIKLPQHKTGEYIHTQHTYATTTTNSRRSRECCFGGVEKETSGIRFSRKRELAMIYEDNYNQVISRVSSIANQVAEIDPDKYLSTFPPGYRFAPTDVEIILHYLTTKVENRPIPINKINEVNLYDHPPEYLTSDKFKSYENVWYYYTSRDRKYRNGVRPNRSAGDGYWKATGVDKKIKAEDGSGTDLGSKKTLVFYRGKAPKGDKTDWIMHEFRVDQSQFERNSRPDMLLDNYVLCRVYNKGPTKSKTGKVESEAESATTAQAQEENAISTTDPMEYSNEKEEEDQRVLNIITDEPAATEVGPMSTNTNDMMTSSMTDTFEGITTFDDKLPNITPYIPPNYHPGPLRVQINNNYMNPSIHASTFEEPYDWGTTTYFDGSDYGSDFLLIDYNDMKVVQGGNYDGSSLSVNQQVLQGGNYDGSPLSVNQKAPMQNGNYYGREQGYKENDNIPVIPDYLQGYPNCPVLSRRRN